MYRFNIGDSVFIVNPQLGTHEPIPEIIEDIQLRNGELYYNSKSPDTIFKTEKEAYLYIKALFEQEQKQCFEKWQLKINEIALKIESL